MIFSTYQIRGKCKAYFPNERSQNAANQHVSNNLTFITSKKYANLQEPVPHFPMQK